MPKCRAHTLKTVRYESADAFPHAEGTPSPVPPAAVKPNKARYFGWGLAALILWGTAYAALEPLARGIVSAFFPSDTAASLGEAVEFFLYDTAKIFMLLILMVYAIGWLRAGMHVERVRDYLAGRGRGAGYLLGAGFGAVTPFCSCSSIPLFLGFTLARIPLGITLAFLITSPLVNEIAVVLLWGLLGWKFTLVYVAVGLGAGVAGGMFMDAVRAERWLQPLLRDALSGSSVPEGGARPVRGRRADALRSPGLAERHACAWSETRAVFRRVWPWVVVGVGLGAALHGLVPQAWFTEHMGAGQWWSVPLAVALGIPLYANVTGIVPVMESLLLKGLPLGTTLAFCMSTVAASLPEALMLKQVMRWKLLAVFLGTLLVLFTLLGWLFNILQAYLV